MCDDSIVCARRCLPSNVTEIMNCDTNQTHPMSSLSTISKWNRRRNGIWGKRDWGSECFSQTASRSPKAMRVVDSKIVIYLRLRSICILFFCHTTTHCRPGNSRERQTSTFKTEQEIQLRKRNKRSHFLYWHNMVESVIVKIYCLLFSYVIIWTDSYMIRVKTPKLCTRN